MTHMNKQVLTVCGRFNLHLFTADIRHDSHDRIDWFTDELDVRRVSRVHLEASEQRPLSERTQMIAEECVVITQQLVLHAKALQPKLMLNNRLHRSDTNTSKKIHHKI